jgi:hypothetical protein
LTPDELRRHKRQVSQKEAIERLFETSDGKLLLDGGFTV